MRQNKTIHTPIERALVSLVQISRLVVVVLSALFVVYVTSTYFFVFIGEINLSYPFMSLDDPIFAILATLIGFFLTILCFGLIFLTLLSNPYDVDATIVILLGFIGIGFAMAAMRTMLPEAAEFLLNNIPFL